MERYCRDCKYVLMNIFPCLWECNHLINIKHDIVTGIKMPCYCSNERKEELITNNNCGYLGKLWKKKEIST